MEIRQIAVLGTGTMGAPIARNLLRAGFGVRVWNRTRARAEALQSEGAIVAGSAAEAVAGADAVITVLADGRAVAGTMRAVAGTTGTATGTMRATVPGNATSARLIWIQMSTVGVAWTARLAEMAGSLGVSFVDAPVSGSAGPAREGTLVILASGPEHALKAAAPVFDAIGRETLNLGEAGRGSALKLALNTWLAVLVEGTAETLALTEALGLEPRVFVRALAGLPLASPYSQAKAAAMIDHDFTPAFPLRHALKDAQLARDTAAEQGLSLPFADAIIDRWRWAAAAGHADEDVASVITASRPAA